MVAPLTVQPIVTPDLKLSNRAIVTEIINMGYLRALFYVFHGRQIIDKFNISVQNVCSTSMAILGTILIVSVVTSRPHKEVGEEIVK